MENHPRPQKFERKRSRSQVSYHRGRQEESDPQGSQHGQSGRSGNNYENSDKDLQRKRRDQSYNKKGRPERAIGFSFIEKLTNNEDLQEVILQLANNKNGFAKLLDSKEISNDLIILLIKLLWRVCDSTFHNVRIMILSTALQSRFLEKLTLYVTLLSCQTLNDKRKNRYFWDKPDDFWQNLINLSKAVQEIIPTNCETIRNLLKTMSVFFPNIEAAHSIHISEEIKAQTVSLLDIVEETIESIQVKRRKIDHNAVAQEPPDDFRRIEIIPSVLEIVAKSSPFLRPNITDRAFNSIDHYLDIQFRLLREDFVAPLRRGINTFLQNQSKAKKDWKKLNDIKVYSPVKFLNEETLNECECYKLCFDVSKKKRTFTYENSKRFMFGSLVCFTSDNFKTLLFGKIVQRDQDLLEQGHLIVGFQDQVRINYDMDYLMVESSVYFEPYYQVLRVLKRMDKETFPMEKYIIRVETDSNPPQYLLKHEPVVYQLQKTTFSPLEFPAEKNFYGFNDAQLSAFKAALTQEFCIIQGPPGTGKTYLGLKIAHALLKNSHAWYEQTPILVICYTNHALDQFLAGIIPTTQSILRVGGQSKNEDLKKYNLASKRRDGYSFNKNLIGRKRLEVRDFVQRLKTLSNTLYQIELNDSIISFDVFKGVVEGYEDTCFPLAKPNDIEKWLLEGKGLAQFERKTNYRQQVQEMHEDEEEKAEDLYLEEDSRNTAWLDDILINVEVPVYKPLITLEQLWSKLNRLKEELTKLTQATACVDVRQIIKQATIRNDIRNTESDLDYISYQLRKYEGRKGIKMPRIDINNPLNIHPDDRWQLYFHWLEQYTVHLRQKYEEDSKTFKEVFKVYNDMREIEDMQIMKQHMVVGMTTTGAARLQSSLQALKSPIIIVEEAAEILEAHIVAALTKHCKHLILIGDHLQLKPGAADYRIETKFKLGISLFERMVNNNIHCHSLNIQHRMKPEISKLIQPHIYQNLADHESTLQRPPILGVDKSLYFIDHQVAEEVCQDASKKNIHESKFLISLARYLVLNEYKPEQITILAAYLGQFYEMIREKKNPINRMLLQDVRISVLDNYQGEESDIILLSLVRSNAENKAGFLKIQNRVCVALSRAKNGLYIMGNMSLLLNSNSENQIWEKVKAVLEEQGAIGPHLTLKCQNHPQKLTHVSKSEDFMPLNEGGCDLMCDTKMVCGHNCKRLCHVEDRDHHRIKCREKCTRLLCDDPTHKCKKSCFIDCGPCSYLMSRDLDCGHKTTIECHIDPSEYKCQELILTKLPCGHEAHKPCSVNADEFKCSNMCDTRVEPCGHACTYRCHIKDDPDHLKYVCKEPCGKPSAECREPKNKHPCQRMCFQECPPCRVSCEKKLDPCGHSAFTFCHDDPKDIWCREPCKKMRPCGHQCKKQCSSACGPCEVMVKKTIEECQHDIKVKCYETPTKKNCKSSKCPKLLTCGHKCTKPCNVACTGICQKIVDCQIEAPCGHLLLRIQCGLKNSSDPELLFKFCTAPCGDKLKCGHTCSGSCGECMQSRIHKRCSEKCGVPLVCNHECPIPCRAACKPCTRPCNMKCRHNKCKKLCGEPCTPCRSRCKRQCPHVQCNRACGDICEVSPCTEKCKRKLKCGHTCVGFCGDPCPPLCRICNKKELTEIFFGTEDEKGATFVLLNDCKHVLEHSGLSNWLKEGGNQIQYKSCPKCKTNITTTERYSDFVKIAMEDVSLAKIGSIGLPKDNETLRKQLFNDLLALQRNRILLEALGKCTGKQPVDNTKMEMKIIVKKEEPWNEWSETNNDNGGSDVKPKHEQELSSNGISSWNLVKTEIIIKEENVDEWLTETDEHLGPMDVKSSALPLSNRFKQDTHEDCTTHEPPVADYQIMQNVELKIPKIENPEKDDQCNVQIYPDSLTDSLKHDRRTVYSCPDCYFKTFYKWSFDAHLLQHVGEVELKCSQCEFEATTKAGLNKHLNRHKNAEGDIIKCTQCNFQTFEKRLFKEHCILHMSPDKYKLISFKCDHCEFRTTRRYTFNAHLVKHKHLQKGTKFKCNECNYETTFKHNFMKHIRRHIDCEVTYNCDLCDYKTTKQMYLVKHLLRHKKPDELIIFKCYNCDFQTIYKTKLKTHLWHHEKKKKLDACVATFKCDQCYFETHRSYNLKMHRLRHENPDKLKQFQCTQCSYRTARKSNFKDHIKRHQRPKKQPSIYKCDHCNYQGTRRNNFYLHLRLHKNLQSDHTNI